MTTIAGLAPRVSEQLNRALHELMARDERLYLLGEDLLDPYGGAFKITKGLSTEYPRRVLSTPLSEGGIVGAGAGLALAGNRVIVEIMFGDFVALGFDQLLNFAAKSVSMYGRRVPVPLLVRCPMGAGRGYGPTHSQSLQKHFIGIADLALYELSPFHSAEAILREAFDRGAPAILFEDKVLYTRRMYAGDRVDDLLRYRMIGSGLGWSHVYPEGSAERPDAVIVAPGGVADRALDAARQLHERHGRAVHVVTPARLYPLDLEPVLPLLAKAGTICVAEESTAGGTWGNEVARGVYERLFASLKAPLVLLNSADSIIPTAGHLERQVVLGAAHIRSAIAASAGWSDPALKADPAPMHHEPGAGSGTALVVPKLNNNDEVYLLVDWLAEEGAWVEAGDDVVSLETSKAVEDIPSPASGYLHRTAVVGQEHPMGAIIGHLLDAPGAAPSPVTEIAKPVVVASAPGSIHQLDRAQVGTAAVVARSHREVPAGFTVVRVRVGAVLDRLAAISDATGAEVGLPEAIVKAVAALHADFPLFFGALLDERTVALADAPNVAVTVDAAGRLFLPVVRRAHEVALEDLADALMDFRLKALAKSFAGHELADGNIGVSLNPDPDVVLVHPIVMWPQLCMVSVGAVCDEYVHVGLAYDHRVINGRDAVLFLQGLKRLLEEPAGLLGGGE